MKKYKQSLLVFAIGFYILIISCPLIDYYVNWYITLIPIILILYQATKYKSAFKSVLKTILLGTILVNFSYYLFHRDAIYLNYSINGIIAWTPCFIAIICNNILKTSSQKKILQIGVIAILITSLTTIQGLSLFPFAARELAGAATEEIRNKYMLMNVGGFEFIYAIVILIPIIFWLIQNTNGILKQINFLVLISTLYCIYVSAYTTALIIAAITILILLMNITPRIRKLLISVIIIFLPLIGTGVLSDFFLYASKSVESEYVADRLLQVSLLLQGQSINNIDTETSNERLILMQNAWEGFCNSPLWGNNWIEWNKTLLSGHSFVLDILSSSGIIGLIIYFLIFYSIFKTCLMCNFKALFFHSKIVWITFIIVTIMNPSAFPIIYLVIFTYTSIINNLSRTNIKCKQ